MLVRISQLWLSNVLVPNLEGSGGMLVTQHSHKTVISGLYVAALTQTIPTDQIQLAVWLLSSLLPFLHLVVRVLGSPPKFCGRKRWRLYHSSLDYLDGCTLHSLHAYATLCLFSLGLRSQTACVSLTELANSAHDGFNGVVDGALSDGFSCQ
jgi:hypothetical protein